MDCQPPQPQAGEALLKRSLEVLSNVETPSAKSQQCSAHLSSNAASAAAQRPGNLDALSDDLFHRVLNTLSPKGVSAAAATCKRFATAWRHAAGTPEPLFPQLSAESCTRLRQYVGDAYATCNDLSTEAGAQDFLVCTFPGRFDAQIVPVSSFDLFYGPLRSRWVNGVELKICHHDSSNPNLDRAVEFWGLAEDLPVIYFESKDRGAHVAESVIY